MSDKIHFKAEFIISEEKIEEFKNLAQQLIEVVEDNEPDTTEYQFYLNDDQSKCAVHETYTNSEAALAHNEGIASKTILPKMLKISQINKFEVYGNISVELEKILSSFNAQKFNIFKGFSR